MQLNRGTRLGRYRMESLVGSGGMGEVYRARDSVLGRDVALKILPPELTADSTRVQRFKQEARAASALTHPNILTIYDIGETSLGDDDGSGQTETLHYISMELVEGETLRAKLAQRIDLTKKIEWLVQAAEGLAKAHEAGIVHRDLKPENIMISRDGFAKILDFGLAKLIEPERRIGGDPSNASTLTHVRTEEGKILGTVGYMSPEQVEGRVVDQRSDIFSFGCILYEAITGERAFTGTSHVDVLHRIVHEEPRAISESSPDVSPELRRIVRKCLAKEADERYQTIKEVAVDLRGWRKLESGAAPISGERRTGLLPRFAGYGIAAFLVLAVSLGLGLLMLAKREGQGPAQQSLVVLPCKVFGEESDQFLADAVPTWLTTNLGAVEGLTMRLPPSHLQIDAKAPDLARVSKFYGVSRCVTCSVHAGPDRISLGVQLVDLHNASIDWSQQLEGPREQYLELARRAADEIRGVIIPASTSLAVLERGLVADAEIAFRKGRYYWTRYNNLHKENDFRTAMGAYQEALRLDPTLSDAAADIAWLYVFALEAGSTALEDAAVHIDLWAKRALMIDDQCARAWAVKAATEWLQGGSEAKVFEYGARSIKYGPHEPFAHSIFSVSDSLIMINQAATDRVIELDPLYLYGWFNSSGWHSLLREWPEALEAIDRALAIEPDSAPMLFMKAFVLWLSEGSGGDRVAQRVLDTLAERLHPTWVTMLEYVVATRRPDEWRAIALHADLMAVLDRPGTDRNTRRQVVSLLVPSMIALGRRKEAIELLDVCARHGVRPPYEQLAAQNEWDAIRDDPIFVRVEKDARRDFESRVEFFQQLKERGELPEYLVEPLNQTIRRFGQRSLRVDRSP